MSEFNWDDFKTVTQETAPKPQDDFNWDNFETVKPQKTPQSESLARGIAQGGSLGFADEISGGVEALWEKSKGNPTEFGKLYQIYRDESRENFKKAQQDNPGTYLTGELGAGIATAFIPGVAAAKGAKLASMAGRAAGFGGVAGAGYSEADNIGDLALDTAKGAAIGGATAAAAPLLGKAAVRVGDKAKGLSKRFAARAIGAERGTIKQLAKTPEAQKKALDELGDYVLRNKLLSPLASTDDLISRNNAVKEAAMNARKAAYDKIDEAGKSTFNPLDVATKVEKKVLDGQNRNYLDTQNLIKKLDPELENIMSRGDGNIPLSEAQKLVEKLGKKSKFDTSRSNESNDLAKTVYNTVRDAINDAAEKSGDSIDLGKVVKDANKTYSTAKSADKLLGNKFAREEGNKLMGITDWSVVGGGLPTAIATGGQSAAITAGTVGTKKALERFGSQNAALLLDKTSKVLSQSPKAVNAAQRNPVLLDQIAGQPIKNELFPALKNVAEEKQKGPEKWANDGAKKLIDSGIDQKLIEQLKQDRRGRELLIDASRVSPGSKGMDGVMKRIRTGYLNKGDQ